MELNLSSHRHSQALETPMVGSHRSGLGESSRNKQENFLFLNTEKPILNLQENIQNSEKQIQSVSQEVAELLLRYSSQYVHEFQQTIHEKRLSEEIHRKQLYNDLEELHKLKSEWRKNVLRKIKFQKDLKTDFGKLLLEQSNILKQYEDHPASQINSEEGFGSFELQANEIIIYQEKKLGSGAFGDVYVGLCRGKQVAVKTLKPTKFSPTVLEEFSRECSIMRSLAHANILLFMGACMIPGNYMLVTEIATNGSLDKFLHPQNQKINQKFHFSRKITMAREIAEGMNWLHKQKPPLLHLDLKPANILLMEDWTVKIADFGISRLQRSIEKVDTTKPENNPQGIGGTPLYMPPEMFEIKPIPTTKCDVYAYGILFWELITEEVPYKGQFNSIVSLTLAVTQNVRPEIPDKIPGTLIHLLMDCWHGNPERRPEFSDILSEQKNVFHQISCDWISLGGSQLSALWSKLTQHRSDISEVPWSVFEIEFCHFMNISVHDNKYTRALKGVQILLDANNGTVKHANLEQFGGWFSPIRRVGEGTNNTFDEVVSLLSQNWFFGNLTSSQATSLLEEASNGVYLVRFSQNQGSSFTISIKTKIKGQVNVHHHRFQPTPGVPIVVALNQFIKQIGGKKSLDGRPSAFIAIFTPELVPVYQAQSTTEEVILRSPWHSDKVIY